MKKLKNLIFFILLFIGFSVHSQTNIWDENPSDSQIELDSLLTILPYTTGKEKIPILNRVAEIYWSINPNKTIDYANDALKQMKSYASNLTRRFLVIFWPTFLSIKI